MLENPSDSSVLSRAFNVIASGDDIETVVIQLRDILRVDHIVYHSSKLGQSPSRDPYIRLTYPASWIKRYLQMGYVDVDPVLREGFPVLYRSNGANSLSLRQKNSNYSAMH